MGNVLLSFICAYGLSLLFESPFMAMEKVMFSRQVSKRTNCSKKSSVNVPETEDSKPKKLKNCDVTEENGIYAIKIKQIEVTD